MLTCQLDLAMQLCVGCGRSRGEIATWSKLSPEARREVMDALPERLLEAGLRP